jgi:nucleoside-diphosphate-sugar epimerase
VRAHVDRIRPELCVHAAWFTTPGKYMTGRENLQLLDASLGLATALADAGCPRLVATGSCFEYDLELGYLDEGSPTRPRSLFAASKAALQLLLEQLGEQAGMETAWARLFYLYGPAEDEQRLVPAVVGALLRGEPTKTTPGEQIRDYLHVDDVATAIRAIAASGTTGIVNVGSAEPVMVRDLVTTMARLAGRPELVELGALPYRQGDPMVVCAVNERLRATGWEPRFTLETGLEDTIGWWRDRYAAAA